MSSTIQINNEGYIKVVDSVSAPVSVWPLEWDISVPINTGVLFQVYRIIYIYIYIYMYIYIHELYSLLKVHIF
jgi:hypothetical protein